MKRAFIEIMEIEKKEKAGLSETVSPARSKLQGSFRNVLGNPAFMLLWMAQLISQIGFNAANFGVLTTVATVTGSTLLSGLAIISFTLPAVPFSLLAGVCVDYLDKRLVLWVSNALRGIASFLMVVALVWKPATVIPLFFLNFFISMVTQFFMPAESSAIPLLVGKENLVPALSLFNITLNVAQAIGFLLLGLLILAIPHNRLRSLLTSEQRLPRSPGKEMWAIVQRDVKGSWQVVRKDKPLYVALLRVSVISILLLVIGELAGVFVKRILGLPPDDLTILFAPAGFGLVLGGLAMPLLARYLSKSLIITLGSILTAAGLILLPASKIVSQVLRFPHPWLSFIVGVLAFVMGVTLDMVNIPAQTVMQERAPEEERGRVLSFQFMLYNAGSIPVLLFAGVISDTLGIDTVMYGIGAALLIFQVWASRHERAMQEQ